MSGVDVLLATYNGARFLHQQLQSIDAQSYGDIRVVLRDDGSNDGTLDLLKDWASKTKHTCLILEDADTGLGARGNFARLLDHSDRPYFMFCDQDDVWASDKVERAVATVRFAEAELGEALPVLAHCDLTVVNEDLGEIAASFWQSQGYGAVSVERSPTADRVRRSLLLRNFVTGCAMIGNAALRDRANPVPDDSAMHDWWLALVAAYTGEIRAIDQPGLRYRQHGSNSLGAKDWSASGVVRRILTEPRAAASRTRNWLSMAKAQARHLNALASEDLPSDDRACLAEFAELNERSFLARKTFMARHKIGAQSTFHSVITWLVI